MSNARDHRGSPGSPARANLTNSSGTTCLRQAAKAGHLEPKTAGRATVELETKAQDGQAGLDHEGANAGAKVRQLEAAGDKEPADGVRIHGALLSSRVRIGLKK